MHKNIYNRKTKENIYILVIRRTKQQSKYVRCANSTGAVPINGHWSMYASNKLCFTHTHTYMLNVHYVHCSFMLTLSFCSTKSAMVLFSIRKAKGKEQQQQRKTERPNGKQ